MLMIILDGTIVSVALPALQADLGFTPAGLAWTVNAYLVPLGGLLLLAGRLGDLYGRRRMLLAGLTLFVLASLLCGLAGTAGMLVVARFVQGVAAAMASAVVLGMIVTLFPEPGERARAMGVYAFVGAAGASIGTLLGGVLTDTVGWRWIFLVNVPIGVAAVLLALRYVAAIVDTAAAPVRLAEAAAALALLAAFVVRQRRAAEPLVRLGIFGSRAVSGGNAVQLLTIAGMMGFQFTVALFLQEALGYTPSETGFAMLPVPAAIAIVSLVLSGPLIARAGARTVLLVGEVLLVAGLLLLVRPGTGSYLVDVLPSMLVLGLGAGLVLPAVTTVMMSDATPADAGLASGLANTSQQVGAALGVAALAALAAARTDGLVAGGVPHVEALTAGYQLAFTASAVLVAVATGLAVAVLRRRA
jgi:MFS family permease